MECALQIQPWMFYRTIACGAIALAVSMGETGRAQGQHPLTRMSGLVLTASAGGAANTALQRAQARAEWELSNGLTATQHFSRRLGVETAVAVGLSAAYWFSPWWGVRVQAGISPSKLEISVSERETTGIPPDSAMVGNERFGSVRIWTYDAELMLRAPFTPHGRVAPYGFVGAGLVEYQVSTVRLPPEASRFESNNRPARIAAVAGVGALVPMQRRNLALVFELSSHLLRTPIERAASARMVGQTVDVVTSVRNSESVKRTSHIKLLVGFSWFAR